MATSMRALVALAALLLPLCAFAGAHTWDVNEVFSNADGTIQFIELREANGTAGETGVGNGTVTSSTRSHSIANGPVAPPTSNKFYLLGTQGFADLPGAPPPDEIIPGGLVPFFSTAGDTVTYVPYDAWTFGAVPTNGTDSLNRTGGVQANSPTNYAGATGSVDANPDEVPLASLPMLVFAALLVAGVGIGALLTRRPSVR
jgi:hypothetical protein